LVSIFVLPDIAVALLVSVHWFSDLTLSPEAMAAPGNL